MQEPGNDTTSGAVLRSDVLAGTVCGTAMTMAMMAMVMVTGTSFLTPPYFSPATVHQV